MTFLYLTSHVLDRDFQAEEGKKLPNPAGQNFHGKLLRALCFAGEVHCYSFVPTVLSLTNRDFEEDKIHYHYRAGPKNRYVRALLWPRLLASSIAKSHKNSADCFVLYDPLSVSIATTAKLLAKKINAKRIPILTDEIANITGVNADYVARIHHLSQDADASIALTQGLTESYGINAKPAFIQPILVEKEEQLPKLPISKPYIYYGGALFVKDGTKDLIEAYETLRPDYDLVIAGHGPYAKEVEEAAKANSRIRFLGQISKKEHYAYIEGSALAVNPRRYQLELDRHAVPSKVMEYLTYGNAVASTLSTPIREAFGDAVNWIEGSLTEFFASHLQAGRFVGLSENKAKNDIVDRFGIAKTGQELQSFFKDLGV